MTLDTALETIRESIEKNRENSPQAAARVTLLAASKGQWDTTIEQAIALGITNFGENRVQEAEGKWTELKKRHPHVRLHLIGPLQTNKVEQAIALFDVIQTLDREKLVDSLAAAFAKHKKTLPCYIQVNTGKEPQKAGVLAEEVDDFIRYCQKAGLMIEGLMCIPPHDQPPTAHFAFLKQIANRHGLSGLSMGMSEDYPEAVRMGASCVRLGRALFGERA